MIIVLIGIGAVLAAALGVLAIYRHLRRVESALRAATSSAADAQRIALARLDCHDTALSRVGEVVAGVSDRLSWLEVGQAKVADVLVALPAVMQAELSAENGRHLAELAARLDAGDEAQQQRMAELRAAVEADRELASMALRISEMARDSASTQPADPSPGYSIADIGDPMRRQQIERHAERRCTAIPMPDDRVLCRVLGRYLMWVDAHDKGLSPHLLMQGYWEMWVTEAIARLTPAGSTSIDIGANVGYYTLLMAEAVGPSGSVIAFEPNPRLADMARNSASINGFGGRVAVRGEAVCDTGAGRLEFAIPRREPKNAGIIRNDAERASYRAQFGDELAFIEATPIRLDDLAPRNVGFIKIDVEGAEAAVWAGMQATLRSNPDVRVAMECNAARGYDCEALYREMAALFPVRHIDFDGSVQPLTLDMLRNERPGQDWMIFLCRS